MILQEDKKGTFRKKVENYKSSNFTNYKQINNLFKILFPELKY